MRMSNRSHKKLNRHPVYIYTEQFLFRFTNSLQKILSTSVNTPLSLTLFYHFIYVYFLPNFNRSRSQIFINLDLLIFIRPKNSIQNNLALLAPVVPFRPFAPGKKAVFNVRIMLAELRSKESDRFKKIRGFA